MGLSDLRAPFFSRHCVIDNTLYGPSLTSQPSTDHDPIFLNRDSGASPLNFTSLGYTLSP